MKKLILLTLSLILAFSLVGCGAKEAAGDTITIGGKDYTEQDLLVQIFAELVEGNTDISVVRKGYLGGSHIVATSLESGDIDMYVEYSGTALMSILKEENFGTADDVFEYVKQKYADEKDLKFLDPLGFNNTYAITMKKTKLEELGISKLSELGSVSGDFVFAAPQEFLERSDGYDNFVEAYNVEFKSVKGMDPGLSYTAVKEDQADASVSFSTDGRIPAFDLQVLTDDLEFFPPYYAAPVVRMDTLEKYPELEELLNSLAGELTDDIMAQLNAQVDIDGIDGKVVANTWLKENGFIK